MNRPEYVKIKDKKYKIDTNFKTAIKCQEVALDIEIDDFERALAILYLLFGDEALEDKDNQIELLKFAKRYLSMNKEVDDSKEPDMDLIQDYDYIKASFRSDYGINLDEENMHWWEFYNLMNGLSNSELGNCCVLNRIRNLRTYDLSDIKDTKTRDKIIKAQKEVALKPRKTKEENELDKFWDDILGGDENGNES